MTDVIMRRDSWLVIGEDDSPTKWMAVDMDVLRDVPHWLTLHGSHFVSERFPAAMSGNILSGCWHLIPRCYIPHAMVILFPAFSMPFPAFTAFDPMA